MLKTENHVTYLNHFFSLGSVRAHICNCIYIIIALYFTIFFPCVSNILFLSLPYKHICQTSVKQHEMKCRKEATMVSFLFCFMMHLILYYFWFKEEKSSKDYVPVKLISLNWLTFDLQRSSSVLMMTVFAYIFSFRNKNAIQSMHLKDSILIYFIVRPV